MSWKLLLLATAMIVPLALAHAPVGTLKNYCEDPNTDWPVHDYAGTSGVQSLSVRPPVYDGNTADCNGNTIPFDYDFHHEWGAGWARLDVVSGDGVTSGTIACYGSYGHHPMFGPFWVEDIVFGPNVHYFVMADSFSITNNGVPDCGDGQITPCPGDPERPNGGGVCIGNDGFAEFFGGWGMVTFPPGIDGAYYVVVVDAAAGGHIIS